MRKSSFFPIISTVILAIVVTVTVTLASQKNTVQTTARAVALVNHDLWLANDSGTPVQQLTHFGDIYTLFPSSAPKIWLFGRATNIPVEGSTRMTLMSWNADTKTTVLEVAEPVVRASLSSNGGTLAYERDGYTLVIRDLVANTTVVVPEKGTEPEISLDGRYLVYNGIQHNTSAFAMPRPSTGLRLYDTTTGVVTTLTTNNEDYNPFWSPDGSAIYFGSANPADGSQAGIFRIDRGGGNRTLVVGEASPALPKAFTFPSERPYFSRDGATLLSIVENQEGDELWSVPLVSRSNINVVPLRFIGITPDHGELITISATGIRERHPLR